MNNRRIRRDLTEDDTASDILNAIAKVDDAQNNTEDGSEEERLAPSDINWGVTIVGNGIRSQCSGYMVWLIFFAVKGGGCLIITHRYK